MGRNEDIACTHIARVRVYIYVDMEVKLVEATGAKDHHRPPHWDGLDGRASSDVSEPSRMILEK